MKSHATRNVEAIQPELGSRLSNAFHAVSDKVQESVGKVREFAANAGEDLAARAESAKATAAAAVETAKEKFQDGKVAAADLIEDLMVDARSMAARVKGYVQDNPGKSFAAAALVGWLAVRKIRKSSKRARH